ncbi:MAG TPA: tetratricopeptide repeat protein [Chryseolinea sp.]|nr:tetratricopeptide repeat protein [Chryseolinea sp.]
MTISSAWTSTTSAFLLCLILSVPTAAQKPSEIVQKYKAALKKTADKDAIKTIVAEAEFTVMDLKFSASLKYKAPHSIRTEMNIMGKAFIQVGNDSLTWEFNPMTNVHVIIKKNQADVGGDALKRGVFLDYRLIDYKALNLDLVYKGTQKLDSVEVFHLELHDKKDDRKVSFYLDTRTYLVYRVEDREGSATFLNYKDFNGFSFPQSAVEVSKAQTISVNYRDVIFNTNIDDAAFIVPESAKLVVHQNDEKARKDYLSADSLYKAGKYQEADLQFSKAISTYGNNRDALNGRGLARIALADYYAAIADFTTAINLFPEYAVSHNNRGLAKYYLKDYPGSKADYDKALVLDPNLVAGYKNRGVVHMQMQHLEDAAKDFEKALKINPDDADASFKYGLSLSVQHKYDTAKRLFDNAYSYGYRSAEFFNYRGVALYQLSRFDSAQINFAEAVRMESTNLQYVENLGRAFMEMGKYDQASEQFETCLLTKKENSEIYNLIGLCRFYDENYKAAIKEFGRAIDLRKDVPNYYGNRGLAKERVDDYVGALSDYSEFIKISPSDPSIFFKRGMVKIKTSHKLEGCMDLGTAKEMGYEEAVAAIMAHCH